MYKNEPVPTARIIIMVGNEKDKKDHQCGGCALLACAVSFAIALVLWVALCVGLLNQYTAINIDIGVMISQINTMACQIVAALGRFSITVCNLRYCS